MFIQTETTPNPNTLKFLPGVTVLSEGTATFTDVMQAKESSPLALELLRIEEVTGVFFGSDFITVTKNDAIDWAVLKPAILTIVMDHFVAGKPVFSGAADKAEEDFDPADDELVHQIKELIETRVRPAVAQDGGDIIFRGFREGVVKLELYGSCSGCPSSTITLKSGIENMLKYYVPEVQSVEAVN